MGSVVVRLFKVVHRHGTRMSTSLTRLPVRRNTMAGEPSPGGQEPRTTKGSCLCGGLVVRPFKVVRRRDMKMGTRMGTSLKARITASY